MSASQHQNRLISSIVFDPWFLSTRLLTFEHFPLINVEIRCWRMGPRCQPHKRRIVWFLGLFFTRDIAATWLSFRYLPLNIAAGWWVPKVSLSIIFYCRLFALWKTQKGHVRSRIRTTDLLYQADWKVAVPTRQHALHVQITPRVLKYISFHDTIL